MGKHNRIIRVPQGIGAPPNRGAPSMPPGDLPEGPPGIQAPPGSAVTEMTELAGLKFRLTKMEEGLLKGQEEKLAADEQVLKLMKENLELRKQLTALRTKAVYEEVGIDLGDSVSLRDGKYYKVHPPKAPAPSAPGAPAPKPPDLKLVRDANGKETIVPKEPTAPPAPDPPAPEKK